MRRKRLTNGTKKSLTDTKISVPINAGMNCPITYAPIHTVLLPVVVALLKRSDSSVIAVKSERAERENSTADPMWKTDWMTQARKLWVRSVPVKRDRSEVLLEEKRM